jgi:hypothetical protein
VFYLGVHHPNWLWSGDFDCHLFVSHGRLRERKGRFPAAVVPGWALDSRGFSELQREGWWTIRPRDYIEHTIRYDCEIGHLDWAAPQDWMCERAIVEGGTWGGQKFVGTRKYLDPGHVLTYEQLAEEHQHRTVANFLELCALWEEYRRRGECTRENPFKPVLQGEPGNVASYLRCAQMYEDAGVRLTDWPVVGVGSVCRIQATPVVGKLARGLAPLGLRLHWFGLKLTGLPEVWPHVSSHDSQSWGAEARRSPRMEGCTHVRVRGRYIGQPSTCANCPRYARRYYGRVNTLGASLAARGWQPELFRDGWLGDAA